MKKIITFLFCILLVTGCNTLDISNTPTKKVETFLNNYQILHEDVLKDLDRVIVKPEEISDTESYKVARDIKNRIEEELQYPGTIKVTVIRETRAIEEAK